MASEKIEPRLQAEIERLQAMNNTGADLPVIVQLLSFAKGSAAGLGDLTEQVSQQQGALLARLSELGVRDVQQMVLSNSVAARLTVAQVEEMANRDDTTRLILNREDSVVA